MPFQPGNKLARGGRKDKPFRNALVMELKSAGEDMPELRKIARGLISRALDNDQASREIADRLDGKPAQAIVGDDDADPVNLLHRIERVIVESTNPDSQGVPPASGPGEV